MRNFARQRWEVVYVAPGGLLQFQHPLNRPLLCTIVDMNFQEFSFYEVG